MIVSGIYRDGGEEIRWADVLFKTKMYRNYLDIIIIIYIKISTTLFIRADNIIIIFYLHHDNTLMTILTYFSIN